MARKPRRSGSKRPYSYSDYRRLSPDENEKAGFTRKARRYVLKSVRRITRRTDTLTARRYETLRTQQEYGLASPEIATQARRDKALAYKSAQQEQAATKGILTNQKKRLAAQINEVVAVGGSIPSGSPKPRRHGTQYRLQSGDDVWIENLIRRHDQYLAGDRSKEIPDGEWQRAVAILDSFNDPRAAYFRQSLGSMSIAA
jgi:co-chaperonin GroES (HSP10)